MQFTNPIFLFYFLPAALLIHRFSLIGRDKNIYPKRAKVTLFALTLIFYGWQEVWWLIPFLVSICFDFLWANLLIRSNTKIWRKIFLVCSILQNLLILGYFKYRGLIINSSSLLNITQDGGLLPLAAGISFYTFESLSFIVDLYRGQIKLKRDSLAPTDFFVFIGMFPRFIAGPIARYNNITKQFNEYRGMFIEKGLLTFICGLFLKISFADQIAKFVPYAFNTQPSIDFISAWIGLVSYSMQIYFDFSGYSLMAIGIGEMLGFQFPTNFRSPYMSLSLSDFWRRWHQSLSAWLRDYLYIPLGGNRGQTWQIYFNLFITMVLGGLWHGSKWTFLLWGAWHGLFLCLEKAFIGEYLKSIFFKRIFVLFVTVLGWIAFRAESVKQIKIIFRGLVGLGGGFFNSDNILAKPFVLGLSLLSILFCFFFEEKLSSQYSLNLDLSYKTKVIGLVLFLITMNCMMSEQDIPFLYFRF